MSDPSAGYESIAPEFLARRGNCATRLHAIGANEVRRWAKTLPSSASVIDLGCGPGFPITVILVEEGFNVYAVDGSASFTAAFRHNLPNVPILCESVLESDFFGRTFNAALAIGLIFLLKAEEQHRLIRRFAEILVPGGRLLFTATADPHRWNDIMTGRESISLGASHYRQLLSDIGFEIISEFEDAGRNHYFDARRY
ncbi:MAG TPA: class I SAM-dependent methyltransferase [Acidobacteriaceae bacterium]